jgi:RNA polymerase sigma-32 factor
MAGRFACTFRHGRSEAMPSFLSRQAERELLVRWIEHKDDSARERIVRHFTPLVEATAARMRCAGPINDDLRQEGFIGLLTALDKFDLAQNVRFGTYAQWWVHAAMSDFVFRQARDVRGSTSPAWKKAFRSGRSTISTISTETPVTETGLTLGQTFVCDAASPEDNAYSSMAVEIVRNAFHEAMKGASNRDREIATERLLNDDPPTLAELAERFGVSRERVRQIENKAAILIGAEVGGV